MRKTDGKQFFELHFGFLLPFQDDCIIISRMKHQARREETIDDEVAVDLQV